MTSYISFEIEPLFENRFFSHLDYFFARSMATAFHEDDPIVLASCALVSKILFDGHICLDLARIAGTVRSVTEDSNDQIKFPSVDTWTGALQNSSIVTDESRISKAHSTGLSPLVLDSDQRLYFSKYYDFQNRLVHNIARRVMSVPLNENEDTAEILLDSCFDKMDVRTIPQRNAVKHTLHHYFTIISGGPGTGKTFVTSLIKKLSLLNAQQQGLMLPKIICVAPTGKAASKMEQGRTIHAVLRPLKNRTGFYYNKNNPLLADLVIIDEASMIDLPLLTRLLEAIPLETRVVMLGDKHQLSSIQAGTVFSDICRVKAVSESLFLLEHNFRSKEKSGIETLAKAINTNNEIALEQILRSSQYPDVSFIDLNDTDSMAARLENHILKGYRFFVTENSPKSALAVLDKFKILCAHNSGEYGTLQINHVCEKILRSGDNFDIEGKLFKKIIMVNTNDYKKNLFNGETGIVIEKKGETFAFFPSFENTLKQFRTSDLPGFDMAFAITIHKSQGSEFDTVLMILPSRISPVVTRQLLYTGVTRAKKRIIIAGNMEIIKQAMNLRIERNSGITGYLEKEILI